MGWIISCIWCIHDDLGDTRWLWMTVYMPPFHLSSFIVIQMGLLVLINWPYIILTTHSILFYFSFQTISDPLYVLIYINCKPIDSIRVVISFTRIIHRHPLSIYATVPAIQNSPNKRKWNSDYRYIHVCLSVVLFSLFINSSDLICYSIFWFRVVNTVVDLVFFFIL